MDTVEEKLVERLARQAFPDVAFGDIHELRDGSFLIWSDGGENFYVVELTNELEGTVEEFEKTSKSAYVTLPCPACDSRGYLLVDTDSTGRLAIQRCDGCFRFNSDNDAVKHVFELAAKGAAGV
jgi:hypothetical protein